MTTYTPLSDCVGILETRIVRRIWVTSSEDIRTVCHEEARPVRCLVWAPNDVQGRPEELRRILMVAIAEAQKA